MKKGSFNLGIIGYPLGHSLSPLIHNAALRELGLKGEYRLYAIPPLPEGSLALADLMDDMRTGKIDGLNVTIPHKQSVVSLLDDLSVVARESGAVNTIFQQKQRLVGDNTDVDGFLIDLKRHLPEDISDKLALVLGAGGAARAVVYGLLREGWQTIVAARRLDQARLLSADLQDQQTALSGKIEPMLMADLRSKDFHKRIAARGDDFTLMVNTTPLGMTPLVKASPWPVGAAWPWHGLAYDLVYNPSETTWMRDAREAGLAAVSGLGMLVEQAALAFERWSGLSAPRHAMMSAVYLHETPIIKRREMS